MERRTFLTGAGVAALLPVAGGAAAKDQSLGMAEPPPDRLPTSPRPCKDSAPRSPAISTASTSTTPWCRSFSAASLPANVRILPMIDLPLTKQDAIPWDFWGMLYEDWKPTPSDGVTVFLEGLENRGDDNLRKRIYFTGVTPDLYAPKYQAKVVDFLRQAS